MEDPQRWDVAVFRYPLSTLVNYVKRLVGMPGESVSIIHGDIYVAPKHESSFTIARKRPELQEAIFRKNPVIPLEATEDFRVSTFKDWWELQNANRFIDQEAGVLHLDAGKAPLIVRSKLRITSERRDPNAADRSGRVDAQQPHPVGDLKFLVEIAPESGAGALVLEIRDCTQPTQPIRLTLAVEGGAPKTSLKHGSQEIADQKLAATHLPVGEESTVALINVDDQIRVELNGETIFSWDYVQSTERPRLGNSQVSFGLTRGKATFDRIALYRDLFYTLYPGTPQAPFRIPDGHYFFLGDNSPNSLDARGWRVVGIRLRENGRIVLGDMEAVSDELSSQRRSSNPWLEGDEPHFIDIRGNHWNLAGRAFDILDLKAFQNPGDVGLLELHGTLLENPGRDELAYADIQLPELRKILAHQQAPFQDFSRLIHYVPRADVVGRAFFVFWPPQRVGIIR